mgnify:CR=1 FL=1
MLAPHSGHPAQRGQARPTRAQSFRSRRKLLIFWQNFARDHEPDNVLIGKDNRPRVADFGLARIEGQTGARATGGGVQLSASLMDSPATPAITQAGGLRASADDGWIMKRVWRAPM